MKDPSGILVDARENHCGDTLSKKGLDGSLACMAAGDHAFSKITTGAATAAS